MEAAAGDTYIPPSSPVLDQFKITFSESRTSPALGPTTITVDLSAAQAAFPIGGSIHNAADQIVAQINAQIAAAPVAAGLRGGASCARGW